MNYLHKKGLLSRHRRIFERLKEINEYFKTIMPQIRRDYPALPQLALEIWKKHKEPLIEKFKKQKFLHVCSNCPTGCCHGQSYRDLFMSEDLILFHCLPEAIGVFDWPEPDWEYFCKNIKTRKTLYLHKEPPSRPSYFSDACLFLSPAGCLLKKWRPKLCLIHTCVRINEKMSIEEKREVNLLTKADIEGLDAYKQWTKELNKTPLHSINKIYSRIDQHRYINQHRYAGGVWENPWSLYWQNLQNKINTELNKKKP